MQNTTYSAAQYVAIDILNYLRKEAVGAANVKTQAKIRTALIQNLRNTPETMRNYKETDVPKDANFREIILKLRAWVGGTFAGEPIANNEMICGNSRGYFLPANDSELRDFKVKLQKTAQSMLSIVQAINQINPDL